MFDRHVALLLALQASASNFDAGGVAVVAAPGAASTSNDTRSDSAALRASTLAAPCPEKPCPAHPGRTYCPSLTTPGQCDHPTHPPCPPCGGPAPGPSPQPIPPPPPKPTHRPWLDDTLPVPERVSLLMSVMTFEEKLLQLVMADLRNGPPPPGARGTPKNETSKVLALGGWGATAGSAVGPPAGPHSDVPGKSVRELDGDCSPPEGVECRIDNLRHMQLQFLNHTRLGIPISFVMETSHAGGPGSTIFPMGVTQGATWNTSLAHAVGEAIALEARSMGIDRGLSPEINVSCTPLHACNCPNMSVRFGAHFWPMLGCDFDPCAICCRLVRFVQIHASEGQRRILEKVRRSITLIHTLLMLLM